MLSRELQTFNKETFQNCCEEWPSTPNKHTHTHNRFTALFGNLFGWAGARRNLLDFVVQGKIAEADTPTIRLGATPCRLISDPPPSPPIFTLDALPTTTLRIYPGLGQAPNMLACISNSISKIFVENWKQKTAQYSLSGSTQCIHVCWWDASDD